MCAYKQKVLNENISGNNSQYLREYLKKNIATTFPPNKCLLPGLMENGFFKCRSFVEMCLLCKIQNVKTNKKLKIKILPLPTSSGASK